MTSQAIAAWHIARLLSGCPINNDVDIGQLPEPYRAIYTRLVQRGENDIAATLDQALFALPQDLAEHAKSLIGAQDPRHEPNEGDGLLAPAEDCDMPVLPKAARIEGDWRLILPNHWLTEYCRYAERAAPMSPPELHCLVGLGILATTIARRVCLYRAGIQIHANVYGLFVAPSTLYHKSTGLNVGRRLLGQAQLTHLLLPEMQTPESLVIELGLQQPPTFAQWPKETRELWLVERTFSAQRSLWLDEASRLFDSSFGRDYTAALRTLILALYECPDRESFQTVSRGRQMVEQAYLCIIGATTPASIKTLLQRETSWSEGLWPRFALVTPSGNLPSFNFLPERAEPSSRLTDHLRVLALERLPMPTASMTEHGVQLKRVQPLVAEIDTEAFTCWEAYAKALSHTLLLCGQVDEQLFSSYGRLPMMAVKIALILATSDWSEQTPTASPIRITATHWQAAQLIVEDWRASLHRLVSLSQTTGEERLQDRILQRVESANGVGITLRDLQRQLHRRRDELERILEGMVKDQQLRIARQAHVNSTETVRYFKFEGTVTAKRPIGDSVTVVTV